MMKAGEFAPTLVGTGGKSVAFDLETEVRETIPHMERLDLNETGLTRAQRRANARAQKNAKARVVALAYGATPVTAQDRKFVAKLKEMQKCQLEQS